MTFDEKLKYIEDQIPGYPHTIRVDNTDFSNLLAALKKCREQRNEYMVFDRFPIDAQLAADAELLKIVEGE